MTQSKPQFAPVLRSLLEDDARATGHATPEQLMAHHAGRLSPEQADLLERHLHGCQECAGLLRDLAEFEEFTPAPVDEVLADPQAQAAWGRLQARLPESVPEPVAGPRSRPVPISSPSSGGRLREVMPEARREPHKSDQAYEPRSLRVGQRSNFLLAAALMAGVVGLGVWVAFLEMKVHRLSKPSDVATLELHADAVRGAERSVISSEGDLVVFLLDPPEVPPAAEFSAELLKAGAAEPLVRAGGLRKMGTTGTLNLLVSRSLLPPGDYQIDLFVEGAGSKPLASYAFSVSSP